MIKIITKKLTLLVFLGLLFSHFNSLNAQAVGDYRSAVATGNWNAFGSWQRYNGAWVAAVAGEYPGNGGNCATCTVTIQTGHVITGNFACTIGALALQGSGRIDMNGLTIDVVGTLTMDGTSVIDRSAGNPILNVNSLVVNATATNATIGRVTLTVATISAINGIFSLNNNNLIKTFTGKVTLAALTGTWSSTGVITAANLIFGGGIQNDNVTANSFQARGCTFSTTQTLSGTGPIALSITNGDDVTINGASIITNNNTNSTNNGVLIEGLLATPGTGSWVQGVNSYLSLGNSANPTISIVTYDFTTNNNTVNYSRAGNQPGILNTNYRNLIISGSGTKTFTQTASRNVAGSFNLVLGVLFNANGGAFTFSVSGNSTIAGTCYSTDATTIISLQDVNLSDGQLGNGTTSTININGNLTMPSGNGIIQRSDVSVTGTTTIATTRTLSLNNNTGIKTFKSNIDVQGTGIFDATTITTIGNLDIRAGVSNAGTFNTNKITFSTGNQTLSGSGTYSFAGAALISGAITVTNQCSSASGVTFTSTLDGNNATSTWLQGNTGVATFINATIPFATLGVLDAYTAAQTNTVYYNGVSNSVYGKANEYYNLVINGTGTPTLTTASIVYGTLTLQTCTFNNTATMLTMASGSTINRYNLGALSNTPTFAGTVNIVYTNGSLSTGVEIPAATAILTNLTINVASGTVTLGSHVTCNGILTLTSGNISLSTFNLTLAATASLVGAFDNTHMVVCNSTGKLIRQGIANADFVMTYPVGTGTVYTPMTISAFTGTFGGGDQISVLPIAVKPALTTAPVPYNSLIKYWRVATSGLSAVTSTITFKYDDAEIFGTEGNYVPRSIYGGALNIVTGPSNNNGANTFTSTGATTIDLNGDWTCIDPTPAVPRSWFSYQSGDWANPLTWTLTVGSYDNPSSLIPSQVAVDDITIKTGHSVYTLVARTVSATVLEAGSDLDIKSTIGNTLGNVSGTGTLKINSFTFPGGVYTNFVAAGGGTVEYYNVTSGSLPSQTTYCNLLLSNSTGSSLIYTLNNPSNPTSYNLNGTFTTNNTGAGNLTFTLGNVSTNTINLNIAGNITNGSGCTFNCALLDAIHTITCSANLINNGIFDVANNAAYSSAATGAAHLAFTGLTNNDFTCNGTTEVYSLTINKGTSQTFSLNLTAPTGSFIFTTNGASGADGIVLTNGTLILGNGINLGRLNGSNSSQYNVSSSLTNTACLKIDGATVNTGNQTLGVYGKFWMVSGTATFGRNGLNLLNASDFVMDGGTLTIERILNGGAGTTIATITINGGILNIDDTPTGTALNDQPKFSMPSTNVTFTMTGGTVNVRNPVNAANCSNGGILLQSALGNYNVTGGTWNVYIPALSTNLDNFYINSTVPFYDLNIYSEGAGSCIAKLDAIGGEVVITTISPLVVLHDFKIGSGADAPVFDANGLNVTVGGNFTVNSNAVYKGHLNTTTLNGPQVSGRIAQIFTVNNAISQKTDLVINKSAGTATMAGSATFNCLNNFTLSSGTFADGGQTIDVSGNIINSGTHSGAGAIKVQRGVRSTSGIPGYTINLPTITGTGIPVTPASFNLTIKNGIVTSISLASGGAGYPGGAGYETLIIAGGNGAGFSCKAERNGAGTLISAFILDGGAGYGPTASEAGGALYETVVTGIVSNVLGAGAGTLTAINVLATGESYAVDATVNITASTPSGATTCIGLTTTAPTIGGSGSGIFSNLSINNDVTGGGAVFTANQTVNGVLNLILGILNINSYNLTLGSAATAIATGPIFSATKMIKTNGLSSAGGLTKTLSALSFTFPIGSNTEYTPGTITLSGVPTIYGSITIKPVASEHPLVSASGQSLTYYWKTSSTGFTLGAATVTQIYTYDQSDVVDNGTTVLETEYVPGKFDLPTVSWIPNPDNTKVDDAVNNTITFDGVLYNTVIDGDYTAGDQTPIASDPFALVLTFYSKNGSSYNWNDGNAWSVDGGLKHIGAAAGLVPSSNSIVRIGDGVTYNHTITISPPDNGMVSGNLLIALGSTLDLTTTTGHNFGACTTPTVGNGTLKISSALATAAFPAGDFTTFLGLTGGTVEYYTTGAQNFTIPTTSAAPTSTSLVNYYNLVLTPATGQYIEMPNLNQTIYNDMTVQGVSSTGVARLNTTSVKTLGITNNLRVTSGNLQFRNGFAQGITVGNDVTVSTGAIFDIENVGTIANSMSIGGSLTVNGTGIFNMIPTTLQSSCALTFTGITNKKITGTGGTIKLYTLTLNKGISQTPLLDVDFIGTFTVPTTYEWLTLTNGTFRWNKASTLTISNTTTPSPFTIPETTCLSLGASGTGINLSYFASNQNSADVFLTGKLEILAGIMNIGKLNQNSNNDIEIDQVGSPVIDVQGSGQLFVNGAIRRKTTSSAGALTYRQSGTSLVTIAGRTNSNLTRGRLEICNTGSSFNMSGTSILEIGRGNGTDPTFGDIYIAPDLASSVASGTLIRLVRASQAENHIFGLNTTIPLANITVNGFDAVNLAELDLLVNPLTLTGNLIISNASSVFNANSFDVTIAGNLTNSNTVASTGVTVGGYRAGSASQITTFNGSTSAQTITGTATPNLTNFGVLVINNSFGTVSLAANTAVRVNSFLTISSPLADGGNTASVLGNITINSTHTGVGKIYMVGTSAQTITGSGSFTNLDLNNSSGTDVAILSNSIVNGVLTFTTGKLSISSYLLTFGSSAGAIVGASNTKFIQSSGSIGNSGVLKLYSNGVGTNITFAFPLGIGSNYRPATYTGTANTTSASLLLKQVNGAHPSTQDPGNTELLTYWNVTETGMSAISVTHTYNYIDPADIQGIETSYVTGRYDPTTGDWNPALGGEAGTSVTTGSDLLTWTAKAYLTGDYTAGYSVEFAALNIFYSRDATLGGNWTDVNSWSTTSHAGAPAATTPSGNKVYIATGHTITIDGNTKKAATIDLDGTAILDCSTYIGLNLGTITGTGTMKIAAGIATFVLPTAVLTAFIASGGGTIYYYGGTNGGLSGSQLTYNNLTFDGASTKTLAAANIAVNGNFTIENTVGNIVNHPSNTITLNGNWINNLGSTGYTSAAGTVNMVNASAARSITGATTFYNLTLNNSSASVPQITINNNITVKKALNMTSGIINLSATKITLGQSASSSTLTSSANTWFTNGSFKRFWLSATAITSNSGSYYGLFPLGENAAASYSPLQINTTVSPTTGGDFTASFTRINGATSLSPFYNDAGTNIELMNNSTFNTAINAVVGGTYNLSCTMTGFTSGTLSDIRLVIPTGLTTATATGTHAAATGSAANPTARRTGITTLADFNNPFALASSNDVVTPLPIMLLWFDAKPNANKVDLKWSTATEINNDYYTVERSKNGLNFESIGIINGAGNSTYLLNYSLVDDNPYSGFSYYRLKQTDFNGKYTYSKIVAVEFQNYNDFNFEVFPNPSSAGEKINVSLSNNKNNEVLVVVYDVTGKKSFSKILVTQIDGENTYALSLSDKLIPGIYMITATSDQNIYSKKLIVR